MGKPVGEVRTGCKLLHRLCGQQQLGEHVSKLRISCKSSGQSVVFPASTVVVSIGRSSNCHFVMPASAYQDGVGREHLTLVRRAGRYHLALNQQNAVWINGTRALDGDVLPERAELWLGKPGACIAVDLLEDNAYPPTVDEDGLNPDPSYRSWRNRIRCVTAAGALVLLAMSFAIYHFTITDNPAVIIEKSAPSVFAILYVNPANGATQFGGTAWMVGEGLLATNVHIARQIRQVAATRLILARNMRVTLEIPCNSRGTDCAQYHAAHSEFERFIAAQSPSRRADDSHQIMNVTYLPGYDVALLRFIVPEGMKGEIPDPLPIATGRELDRLAPGDSLVMIGYPNENLSQGSFQIESPVPTPLTGKFAGYRTFFLTRGRNDPGPLVLHDIPSTGGHSGSPLINAAGKVVGVHFAGNMRTVRSEGSEIRIPVLDLNFAQRADLIAEIIDNTDQALLEDKQQQWSEWLSLYESMPEQLMALTTDKLDRTYGNESRSIRDAGELNWSETSPYLGANRFDREFSVDKPMHCAFYVRSHNAQGDVSLSVVEVGGRRLGSYAARTHYGITDFLVDSGSRIRARAVGEGTSGAFVWGINCWKRAES